MIEDTVFEMIFTLRGQKVMIDRDLASLYEIETKRLNEQVKRNLDRFEGYTFQLSDSEKEKLVANCDRFKALKHSTSNPYAFNEHGVLMLSSILNSKVAVEINRKIIKVFVELRQKISAQPEYALLREMVKRIEAEHKHFKAEQSALKMTQTVDNKLLTDKMAQLSNKVNHMSDILDTFQDNHLIIKRPKNGEFEG